jgi:hypothetical protein
MPEIPPGESDVSGRPGVTAGDLLWPLAFAALVYAGWSTPFVFPLKIFVVFLHELSHGLAAVLTGGSIVRIELSPDEGGLCTTLGGWPFVITSAGYLGSLLFGASFLVAGGRARPAVQGLLVGLTGAAVLGGTVSWVRTAFGFAWGVGAGAALLAVAVWLPRGAAVFVLRLLGVTSCLYAVWDIVSDLVLRSVPRSDANALARMTGIPGIVWGLLWAAAAVWILLSALRAAARGA